MSPWKILAFVAVPLLAVVALAFLPTADCPKCAPAVPVCGTCGSADPDRPGKITAVERWAWGEPDAMRIRQGSRKKPSVARIIIVRRRPAVPDELDNSNCSYASLGLRTHPLVWELFPEVERHWLCSRKIESRTIGTTPCLCGEGGLTSTHR